MFTSFTKKTFLSFVVAVTLVAAGTAIAAERVNYATNRAPNVGSDGKNYNFDYNLDLDDEALIDALDRDHPVATPYPSADGTNPSMGSDGKLYTDYVKNTDADALIDALERDHPVHGPYSQGGDPSMGSDGKSYTEYTRDTDAVDLMDALERDHPVSTPF